MKKEKSKSAARVTCNFPIKSSSCDSLTCRRNDYNTSDCLSQINNELKLKWKNKKIDSVYLSEIYFNMGLYSLSSRVSLCGSILEFTSYSLPLLPANLRANGRQEVKLTNANFCRDRLCPMCAWRRSYKIYSQLSRVIDYLDNQYSYLFLTLTIPNVRSDALSDAIDKLTKGFNLLLKRKRVKNAVKGYFKALEITYNAKTLSFHPHLHIVLAVSPSYFTSRDYIKRSEWLFLWQHSVNDFSINQVDIRKCKSIQSEGLSKTVAEVAKYSVKSSDYLDKNDFIYSLELVNVLYYSLKNRRLCSFGGVFKDVRHKLNLDDCENGDLIHIDDNINAAIACQVFVYGWSAGCYKLVDIKS